jgi:D-amino peptidase
MKIYIMVDFEGIAGFLEWDDPADNTPGGHEKRHRLRTFLSKEVDAAVNACFESGAKEVLVWDSHLPSGNCNNIYIEMLHPEAQVIQGHKGLPSFYPLLDESFDAGMYIGMHASEGTPNAITPHTRTVLNGHELGEGGMFVAMCAHFKVPTVFVSGDSAAIDQVLEQIPEVEHVKTKWAFGPYSAKTRTPQKSCELIHAGVRKAISRRKDIPPWKLEPPYVIGEPDGEEFKGDDLFQLYNFEVLKDANWGTQEIQPQRDQVNEYKQGLRYNYHQ